MRQKWYKLRSSLLLSNPRTKKAKNVSTPSVAVPCLPSNSIGTQPGRSSLRTMKSSSISKSSDDSVPDILSVSVSRCTFWLLVECHGKEVNWRSGNQKFESPDIVAMFKERLGLPSRSLKFKPRHMHPHMRFDLLLQTNYPLSTLWRLPLLFVASGQPTRVCFNNNSKT